MKDGNEPKQAKAGMKPQLQTGDHGPIKSAQLDERTAGRRWDIPRGSETETRGSAGRRG